MPEKRYSLNDGEYADTFYSHMGKVIDEMKLARLGAANGINYLKGRGVKDEEIKWSGIEEFLAGKKSVSKEELQEFVRNNQLVIEEEVLSDEELLYTAEQREQMDYYTQQKDAIYDRIAKLWEETYHEELPVNRDAIGGFGDLVQAQLRDKLIKARESTPEGLAYKEAQAELREIIAKNDDFYYDN